MRAVAVTLVLALAACGRSAKTLQSEPPPEEKLFRHVPDVVEIKGNIGESGKIQIRNVAPSRLVMLRGSAPVRVSVEEVGFWNAVEIPDGMTARWVGPAPEGCKLSKAEVKKSSESTPGIAYEFWGWDSASNPVCETLLTSVSKNGFTLEFKESRLGSRQSIPQLVLRLE